jgi:plastocyanin
MARLIRPGRRRHISRVKRLFAGLQVALLAIALNAGASAATPPLLPAVATVHIKDFKYSPPALTIHVGDRITFVNDDDEAHTVTATDKSFDSEGLDTSGTWQHVFTKPGTYRYFCELHPYMKATVVVLPAKPAQ